VVKPGLQLPQKFSKTCLVVRYINKLQPFSPTENSITSYNPFAPPSRKYQLIAALGQTYELTFVKLNLTKVSW